MIEKNIDKEMDFVAVNEKGEEYYQVSYSVKEKEPLERGLNTLDNISDYN